MNDRIDSAIDLVKRHEGLRLSPYYDTTGHLTIGYGRNLEAEGISLAEANIMLENDLIKVSAALGAYSWFRNAPLPQQAVLIDMAHNMGVNGLLGFHNMILCLGNGDYAGAADAMLASKWAVQVPSRAQEDASIMRGTSNSEILRIY